MREVTIKFFKGGQIRVAVPGWDKSAFPNEIQELQDLQTRKLREPTNLLDRAMTYLQGVTFERNGYLGMLKDGRGQVVRFTLEKDGVRVDNKDLYNFRNRLLYSGKDLAQEILMAVHAEACRVVFEELGYTVQVKAPATGDVVEVHATKEVQG